MTNMAIGGDILHFFTPFDGDYFIQTQDLTN